LLETRIAYTSMGNDIRVMAMAAVLWWWSAC
jgi:hypothetical protein